MKCTRCKKQEAGAGYKQCDACRERGRAYMRKHMRDHHEQYNERMRVYMAATGREQRKIERELEK